MQLEDRFDIKAFLDSCIGLSFHEIVPKVQNEIRMVENISHGIKGAVANREAGSYQYAAELKHFAYFLANGFSYSARQGLFYPVIKSLVDKGEFKPSILDAFKGHRMR